MYCGLGSLSGGFCASLPCGGSSWRINLARLKCSLPGLRGLYLLLCFSLSLGIGMSFCAGVSGWRVAALAGLQEPCWHGSVLGLICSPPLPYGPLLLLFISDPSSPAHGRGRCLLSSPRLSALCSTLPKSLHALSPWEELLLGSVFSKFNPRAQTLLLSVGLILRGVSAVILPRAGA